MSKLTRSNEKGQSMVLVVLMLLAFIAMLALVLDGGLAYSSRRKAQNAADAGALAGAAVLCEPDKYADDAKTVAETYAMVNNGASSALATIDNTLKTVNVDASVNYTTTFAAVLGLPVGTAGATANAACSPVCGGSNILPVVWSCKAPVGYSESTDCQIQYDPTKLYIIMDTFPFDTNTKCISEGGSINCDLDGDGDDDISGESGNRSWLNLDGSTDPTANLDDYITGKKSVLVQSHMWLSSISGVNQKIFDYADDLTGKTVLIPVFDTYCLKTDGTCPPNPLPHPEDIDQTDNDDVLNFHIHTLAAFKVTCVLNKPQSDPPCTARSAFIAKNPDLFLPPPGEINENAFLTIEGYFVEGYSPETLACNPGAPIDDVGNYTVVLLP